MLNDIYMSDEASKIKLNRDVSKELAQEIQMYKDEKRNMRYSIKGETRDGKSYVGLKFGDIITSDTDQDFGTEIENIVCGNQIEYREKLKNAKFGDFYLVDENFFTRAGLGANIESQQLTDYNNIIAKQNISVTFITPQKFLNMGATLGFSTYGRDSKNWLSRCLVYKFKDNFPYLIGYVVLDIGELFRKYGCYIYKFTGGCTNTKKLNLEDLDKDIVKESTCIGDLKKHKDEIVDDKSTCPFYKFCKNPMALYEKKKDTWIEKELAGGLDERTKERFGLALNLILEMVVEYSEEKGLIMLNARNGKDLKNRIRLKVPKYTNTKMGIGEFEELIEIVKTNTDLEMFKESLNQIKDEKILSKALENEILKGYFTEFKFVENEE